MNSVGENELQSIRNVFEKTISLVNATIGDRAFRLVRALNAAVFESVMVGLAHRLGKQGVPDNAKILAAYDILLADDNYRQACSTSTALEENVKSRLTLATEAFANT
jgi:hypothetical protein